MYMKINEKYEDCENMKIYVYEDNEKSEDCERSTYHTHTRTIIEQLNSNHTRLVRQMTLHYSHLFFY